MKKTQRTIYVFESGVVHVEVEGNTVAVQVADPATQKVALKFVCPLPAAMQMVEVLSTALAASGEVVNEMSVVPTGAGSAYGVPEGD